MEMKHTPGPWRLYTIYGGGYMVGAGTRGNSQRIAQDVDETELPKGCLSKFRRGEKRANARLIAAAPDLLAACIAAKKLLEQSAEECTDAMEERECPICEAVEMCRLAIGKATVP